MLQSLDLMQISQKLGFPAVIVIFINKFAVFHLNPPLTTVTLDLLVGLQLLLNFQERVDLLDHQRCIEDSLLYLILVFRLIGISFT